MMYADSEEALDIDDHGVYETWQLGASVRLSQALSCVGPGSSATMLTGDESGGVKSDSVRSQNSLGFIGPSGLPWNPLAEGQQREGCETKATFRRRFTSTDWLSSRRALAAFVEVDPSPVSRGCPRSLRLTFPSP